MARTATKSKRDPRETRRRIVEAVVSLHEEVGPAATTISAIAERAGVQRLTVYRHFPDEEALVRACSSHWSAEHARPDPASWAGLQDPAERLRAALRALYAHYRDGAPMLRRVLRDEDEVPAVAEVMTPFHAYLREIAGSLAAGWGVDGGEQRLVRAAVGHAVRFTTWSSLDAQGLEVAEAADLMTRFVACVAGADAAA